MHPTGMLSYADDMSMGRRGFGLNPPGPSLVVATDHNPVYSSDMKTIEDTTKLDETELILSSPIVYGFSLSDKVWRALSFFPPWIFYADNIQSSSTSTMSLDSSGTMNLSKISYLLKIKRSLFSHSLRHIH